MGLELNFAVDLSQKKKQLENGNRKRTSKMARKVNGSKLSVKKIRNRSQKFYFDAKFSSFPTFFKEMTTLLSFMNFVFDNIGRNSPYANNPEVFGKLDRVIQLLRSRSGEQLSFSLKVLVLNSRH